MRWELHLIQDPEMTYDNVSWKNTQLLLRYSPFVEKQKHGGHMKLTSGMMRVTKETLQLSI
jgi:hypothetical protein